MEERNKETFEKLDTAVKSNHLNMFLLGCGFYKIPSSSMDAQTTLNTGAIMRAIYYYSKNVLNLADKLQTSLEFIANLKTFPAIYTVLEIEKYQLNAESNNVAPFKLNNNNILQILSNNLKSNKELYKESGEIGDLKLDNGLMPILEEYDKDLNDNYGHKIL